MQYKTVQCTWTKGIRKRPTGSAFRSSGALSRDVVLPVADADARLSVSESDESDSPVDKTFLLQIGQTFLFLVNHGSIHLQWYAVNKV